VTPLKELPKRQLGASPLHDLLRKISQTCNRGKTKERKINI